MYHDTKKHPLRRALVLLALALAAAAVLTAAVRGSRRQMDDEGAAAIQAAIRSSALQCYVVEGVYPPNLTYLQEHYGLTVNTRDYYVLYDAFASNLPPTVRVVSRAGQ